ncbi:MAG: AMP-binding protein [Clostridia bacterium]|nr:AMP-binding protein [Clostridia bacterium]
MNVKSRFPVNNPFYDVRYIRDFKDLINQSENLFSERPAYKLRNRDGIYYEVTYSSFRHSIYYLANSLVNDNYSRTHIAVVGANSYNWSVTYLAVTCSDNVIVPIDKELTPDNMMDVIKDSDSTILFGDKKYITSIEARKDELPDGFRFICFDDVEIDGVEYFEDYLDIGRNLYRSGVKHLDNITVDPEATTAILFTSGTTGVSKGVCLSQKNICSVVMGAAGCIKVTEEDQLLSVLPIHHTYECTVGFLYIIYSGACISFNQGLRYITRDFKEVKPTCFITVPLLIEKVHAKIMKKMEEKTAGKLIFKIGKYASKFSKAMGIKDLDRKIFSEVLETFGGKLRLIVTGAAAIDPRVAEDFMHMGIDLYIGYGLTECAPLVACNNDRLMLPDSIGTPMPGAEVAIYNPDDLGVGEIWVRGPMVMNGYYKNQEATDEVITPDGWFRTGDLGTCDRHNCYKITGRCKNVIVTKNGKNIFPEEVELYLNTNPVIEESIVYADDVDDETLVSVQIYPNYEQIKNNLKRQDITKEDVQKSVEEAVKDVNKKLPKYKKIRNIEISEQEFEKTTTKKIKRHANLKNKKENTETTKVEIEE